VLAGLVMFIVGLKKTWRYVRPSENDFGRGLSNRFAFFLGASTGLLALAIHSCVDFNLHIPANAILGVTLLALLSGNLRFATEDYWVGPGRPRKGLVTLALLAGIVYLGSQGWRRAHETVWLARAEQSPVYSPAQAANLEKAFQAEPGNFNTAYNLGETYRVESFDGGQNYETLAKTAMQWYERGMKLNPHDGYNYLGYGMCLDWLDQHAEAGPYFNRADALDPNGYFTAANIGWHYVQVGDYAAARSWLERSLRLYMPQNGAAASYLEIAERKLAEGASGQSLLPAVFERK
jgi:tetratricopeptide (TPR) repeat protein